MQKPSLHTEQVWYARQLFLLAIVGLLNLAAAEALEFPLGAKVIAAVPVLIAILLIPFYPRRKDED